MNAKILQTFTIVGFFSMSLLATLTISWGMTGLIKSEKQNQLCQPTTLTSKSTILVKKQACTQLDLNDTFKSLVPKNLFKSG